MRKDDSRCIYNEPETSCMTSGEPRSDIMQSRLNRLESIVANLMTENPNSGPPQKVSSAVNPANASNGAQSLHKGSATPEKGHELSEASKSLGTLRIEDDRFCYRGSTHWDDVLHEVSLGLNLCFGSI